MVPADPGFVQVSDARLESVVFDWAGTTVDYGSIAPVLAFTELFKRQQVHVGPDDIRPYMGMRKRQQLGCILALEHVSAQWRAVWGCFPSEADLDALYARFEPVLADVLPACSVPINGAVDLAEELRRAGVKIGSTTGYTRATMDVVEAEAKRHGFLTDATVCSDEVPAGRPAPFMIYANALKLGVYPLERMIKIGDADVDMGEGVNAGMWTVGVVRGGSLLGLTQAEVESLPTSEIAARCEVVRASLLHQGAHYVIESLADATSVIDEICDRIAVGDTPARRECHPGCL